MTDERETSSVVVGCFDDDGLGIATVCKLWREPDERPSATVARVAVSGLVGPSPILLLSGHVCFSSLLLQCMHQLEDMV